LNSFETLLRFNIIIIIIIYFLKISDGKNPSPANYNVKPLIDGTGKIFVSSYRSGMAKSILTKLNGRKNRWNSN